MTTPTEEQMRRMLLDSEHFANPALLQQIYSTERLFEQQRRATEAQRRVDQHAADCSDAARRAQIAIMLEEQRVFMQVGDPLAPLPRARVKAYVKKKEPFVAVDTAIAGETATMVIVDDSGWTYFPDPPLKPPAIVVREETATDRAAGFVPLPSVKKVIVEDNGPRATFPAGAFPARAMR